MTPPPALSDAFKSVGIIAVAGDTLDLSYLRHWAAELGVHKQLERALEMAASD